MKFLWYMVLKFLSKNEIQKDLPNIDNLNITISYREFCELHMPFREARFEIVLRLLAKDGVKPHGLFTLVLE